MFKLPPQTPENRDLNLNTSDSPSLLFVSRTSSAILRRSFRRVMRVACALDTQLRTIWMAGAGEDKRMVTLCVELANNSLLDEPFLVDSVEVKVEDTTRGIRALQDSEQILLEPYDQHNLLFSIEAETLFQRTSPAPVLPPATPLAALLTPSQVFATSRPSDPRMRAPARQDIAQLPEAERVVHVVVKGHPIHRGSSLAEKSAQEKSSPTAPFTSTWDTLISSNTSRNTNSIEDSRRRSESVLAGTAAMTKTATSIGIRSSLISVPKASGEIKMRSQLQSVASVPQPLVQAIAGSKRHTIAGLLQASKSMAAHLPTANERPSLSRHPSRQSSHNVKTIGQPTSSQQQQNQSATNANTSTSTLVRGALPPHMVTQIRRPGSPKRSTSASALPTLGSSLHTEIGSPSQDFTESLDSVSTRASGLEPARPPLSTLGFSADLQPVRSISGPQQGHRNSFSMASRTSGIRYGSAIRQQLGLPSIQHVPVPSPKIEGKIIVFMSVLSVQDTAANLGLDIENEEIAGHKSNVNDGELQVTLMQNRLAKFKLGTPPTPAISTTDTPTPKLKRLSQGVSLHVFDIFLIEIFVVNESNQACSLHIRVPVSPGEKGSAGILALDNEISLG